MPDDIIATLKMVMNVMLRSSIFQTSTVVVDLVKIFDELNKSKESLGKKVDQVVNSLKQASALISELENDLKERSEKIKILRDEIERYSKISEVEEEKAKVILAEVQASLDKGKNTERWIAFGINLLAGIIFFVLGIFVGPMLSNWLAR